MTALSKKHKEIIYKIVDEIGNDIKNLENFAKWHSAREISESEDDTFDLMWDVLSGQYEVIKIKSLDEFKLWFYNQFIDFDDEDNDDYPLTWFDEFKTSFRCIKP